MAQLPSGTVSASEVNTALGRSSTAALSWNDDSFRFLCNQTTGTVSINNLRGRKYARGTVTVGVYNFKEGPAYGRVNQSSAQAGSMAVLENFDSGLTWWEFNSQASVGFSTITLSYNSSQLGTSSFRVKVASLAQNTYSFTGNSGFGYGYNVSGAYPFNSGNLNQTVSWQACF